MLAPFLFPLLALMRLHGQPDLTTLSLCWLILEAHRSLTRLSSGQVTIQSQSMTLNHILSGLIWMVLRRPTLLTITILLLRIGLRELCKLLHSQTMHEHLKLVPTVEITLPGLLIVWDLLEIGRAMQHLMYGLFSLKMHQTKGHACSVSELPVPFLCQMEADLIHNFSKLHAAGEMESTPTYAPSTSMTGLCNHLVAEHLEEWVDGCDKLNIKITVKEARTHVDKLWQHRRQHVPEAPSPGIRKQYLNEVFIDTIIA